MAQNRVAEKPCWCLTYHMHGMTGLSDWVLVFWHNLWVQRKWKMEENRKTNLMIIYHKGKDDGLRMKSEKYRLIFERVAFSSFSSFIQRWWKSEKRDRKRCLMSWWYCQRKRQTLVTRSHRAAEVEGTQERHMQRPELTIEETEESLDRNEKRKD